MGTETAITMTRTRMPRIIATARLRARRHYDPADAEWRSYVGTPDEEAIREIAASIGQDDVVLHASRVRGDRIMDALRRQARPGEHIEAETYCSTVERTPDGPDTRVVVSYDEARDVMYETTYMAVYGDICDGWQIWSHARKLPRYPRTVSDDRLMYFRPENWHSLSGCYVHGENAATRACRRKWGEHCWDSPDEDFGHPDVDGEMWCLMCGAKASAK